VQYLVEEVDAIVEQWIGMVGEEGSRKCVVWRMGH
jgi:hypothetical protein